MRKVGAFEADDGQLFLDANSAHDHEIGQKVKELHTIRGSSDSDLSTYVSTFVVQNKDLLLAILEKPKL